MKKIISTLYIIFLCMNLHAQEYNINYEFERVQKICIEDIPDIDSLIENGIFIYGNDNHGADNQDLFKKNIQGPNSGLKLSRVNLGKIFVEDYCDGSVLVLRQAAYFKSAGWCPDSKSKITVKFIKKQCPLNLDTVSTREDSYAIAERQASTIEKTSLKHEQDSGAYQSNYRDEYNYKVIFWALILVCIIIIIFLVPKCFKWQNRKKTVEVFNQVLSHEELLKLFQNEHIHEYLTHVAQETFDKKGSETVKTEVKDFMSQILASDEFSNQLNDVVEAVFESKKNILLSNPAQVYLSPSLNQPVVADRENRHFVTNDVTYDRTDNAFYVDTQSQHLFDIYSCDGKFFYTLSKNRNIRSNLVQGIGYYDKCINIIETLGNELIVPVEDGHLTRVNDRYMVDVSSVLKVKIE